MDDDRLERLWRSAANQPTPAETARLMEETMTTLARRRTRTLTALGFAGALLAVFTGAVGWSLLQGGLDLSREWAVGLTLALSWTAFLIVRLQLSAHLARHRGVEGSVADGLRAALDENRTARLRYWTMLAVTVVFAAGLALALGQLEAVGKMEPAHVLQAGALLVAGLLVTLAINTWRLVFRLRPERRRLEEVLAQYD